MWHNAEMLRYSVSTCSLLPESKKKREEEKGKKQNKTQETLTDAMFNQGNSAVSLMEQPIIFQARYILLPQQYI